ncbi:Hypothetical predicted protein [Olea europaea subsp. europaea]|uniref:Uncharacterized protein n=1 Tax=Olea europaea subsp. europaea TaxID=158383 RepID=A0A8S0TLJ8_OLEEU|nr:Hypothetical predicted protein [Olea europaea subsp. europaea]
MCTQPSLSSPNVVFNSQGVNFAYPLLPHPEVAVIGTSQVAYNFLQVQGLDSFPRATHLANLSNVVPISHPTMSFHKDAGISDDSRFFSFFHVFADPNFHLGANFANPHLPHPEVAVTGTSQVAYNFLQVQGSDSFPRATHLVNLSNVVPISHPTMSFHKDAGISDDR